MNAPTYRASRWFFLRLLGLTSSVAFLSLGAQVRGLVGEHGILPVGDYLAAVRAALGGGAAAQLPTLFWLGSGDGALLTVTALGLAASLCLALGWLEGPSIVAAWVAYLSLSVAGQAFLSFQWDSLLLEALLCAALWARWGWRSRLADPERPAGRWLLWLLLFKVMFLSGITKLLSGDPTWRDLSALTYHYLTQPLPSWISWFVFRAPRAFHQASVVAMLVVEMLLPLLLLSPWRRRAARRLAAVGFAGLQFIIAWTGNYGFFNLLAAALAVPLIDDDVWRGARRRLPDPEAAAPANRRFGFAAALAWPLAVLSLLAFAAEMQSTARRSLPGWERAVLGAIGPWRSINGYGLFRVMTTERPEIAIEIEDGSGAWRELVFRYKPGPLDRRPPIVPLHMPRLDWQMWFAALDPSRGERWLAPFLERLLRGEPAVWELLGEARPSEPPRAVRLRLWRYRFATAKERRAEGRWWERQEISQLSGEIELDPAGGLRLRGPGSS